MASLRAGANAPDGLRCEDLMVVMKEPGPGLRNICALSPGMLKGWHRSPSQSLDPWHTVVALDRKEALFRACCPVCRL